ncbi:MAG: hypothetical protein PWQ39_404 [Thermacetogenium sp.]|nr:hypothetical protein [Thermacetogenium sp.]
MRRMFYHIEGVLRGGVVRCAACGAELDGNLMSPKPCIEATASVTCDEKGLKWFINVWNWTAEVLAETPEGKYLKAVPEDEAAEEFEEKVLDAVDRQGAINISGHYSVTDELMEYLKGGVEAGRIRVETV